MENSSGLGPKASIPPELKGWNWGAFFLNWIWGLGNSTYISLLTLVPPLTFVMPFILGAKGNEWAWRNTQWQSIEHFRRVQKNWTIAALILFGVSVIGGVGGVLGGLYALSNSVAYQNAVARVTASPDAIRVLGEPIRPGWPTGEVSIKDDVGNASLKFSVTGPKSSGSVLVEANRKGKEWTFNRILLRPERGDAQIDLR